MKWSVALLALALGCTGKAVPTDDDTDTDTDEPDDPKVETDCNDGLDNDEDGAMDCDDSDCAEAFSCTWPDALDHETEMLFDGRTIECEIFGTAFDYDVDDCETRFSADLTYDETDDTCSECDRVYKGPLTWEQDSCSELLGEDGPKPETTEYGLKFVSETLRTVYVNDPNTGWTKAVDLVQEGEQWQNVTSVEIREDVDECNNGVQYLGDLTVTSLFTDL